MRRTRLMIVVCAGLLAGAVTAYCGPIAFIGVAVPHIARGLFATSDLSTYPLPISTVSALFGAPIIIWIILKK